MPMPAPAERIYHPRSQASSTAAHPEGIDVVDVTTGQRARVVLKRGVAAVTVAKLKTHLEAFFDVPAAEQILRYKGRELFDEMAGVDAGLRPDCTVEFSSIRGNWLPPPSTGGGREDCGDDRSSCTGNTVDRYRHCRCCNCRRTAVDPLAPGGGGGGGGGGRCRDGGFEDEERPHRAFRRQQPQPPQAPAAAAPPNRLEEEQRKLAALQNGYTNLVKKQQWVFEAANNNGAAVVCQARLTHEAAYKAGTAGLGGLGVAELHAPQLRYY